MIGRRRPEVGGQGGRPVVVQLIGVQPDAEVVRASGFEHLAGLVEAERVCVDEGVGVFRQTVRGDLREHRLDQQSHVRFAVGLVFLRDRVGSEERGDEIDRMTRGAVAQRA